jgi:hypothetical protein
MAQCRCVAVLLSVIFLVLDSLVAAWYFMPQLSMFDPVRAFYRWFQPFGIVNAYGVFPPHPFPSERILPVMEGSADGVEWKEYEVRFVSTKEESRPPLHLGPYHPRYVCFPPLSDCLLTDAGRCMLMVFTV